MTLIDVDAFYKELVEEKKRKRESLQYGYEKDKDISQKKADRTISEQEFEFKWEPDRIRFVYTDNLHLLAYRLFVKPDFSAQDGATESEIRAALEFDQNIEAYASRNVTEVDESREGILCTEEDPTIESHKPRRRPPPVEVKQSKGFFARVCNKEKVSKCDLV